MIASTCDGEQRVILDHVSWATYASLADESSYVGHVAAVQGKGAIDLAADPPPDLVIEVDIRRSSLRRFDVCRGMRVPEVWRCDGQTLQIWIHRQAGQYDESAASSVLLPLAARDLMRFLALRSSTGETQIARSFRQWVRERFTGTACRCARGRGLVIRGSKAP